MDIEEKQIDDQPTDVVPESANVDADTPEVSEVSADEAENKVDEVLGTEPVGDESSDPDPILNYFPNVEINEANRAELQSAVELIEKGKKLDEINQELATIFYTEPDIANIILSLREGATLQEAIALHLDDVDSMAPMEGPDKAKWEENRGIRAKKREESQMKKGKRKENEAKSKANLLKFVEDNKLDEEKADAFYDFMFDLLTQVFDNVLTSEIIMHFYRSFTFDSEIEGAAEMGKVNGQNAKIDKLQEKDSKNLTSGLPALDGGGGNIDNASKRKKSYGEDFFDGVL